ncbi:TrmB family transcriptional regulator [Candidatus Woesearchaeota archaeon]|nr:TrmB family transcriptional regulator [Candidatus Woesearchaeota archaeon]
MIVKDELLSKLRRYFSLNLYEVKIWTALLSRGVSTAGELSDIANVPRSRSYDVLESLEKKGFILMKLGKPIKYLAIPPGEVVSRVKKNMREDAEERIKRLESMKGTDLLTELQTLHTQGIELVEPADLAGYVRGRLNLYNHLELILKSAEKTVNIMTTSQGFLRKMEGLRPVLEKIKKKGVRIRVAAPLTRECKNALQEVKDLIEVRHTKSINSRFCVVDGKELLFMVLNDAEVHPTYDVGVWIKTPFFASALDNLFNTAWKEMQPPEEGLK